MVGVRGVDRMVEEVLLVELAEEVLLAEIEEHQATTQDGDGLFLPDHLFSWDALHALWDVGRIVPGGRLTSGGGKLGWYSVRMIEADHVEALAIEAWRNATVEATDADAYEYVRQTLGRDAGGYDIRAIVTEIHEARGTWDMDAVPYSVFWGAVRRGASTPPVYTPSAVVHALVTRYVENLRTVRPSEPRGTLNQAEMIVLAVVTESGMPEQAAMEFVGDLIEDKMAS